MDALAEAELDDLMWLIDSSLPSLSMEGMTQRKPLAYVNPDSPAIDSGYADGKLLRTLSKKQLLIIIRDLKKEMQQEKKEKEYLWLACQAMFQQGK